LKNQIVERVESPPDVSQAELGYNLFDCEQKYLFAVSLLKCPPGYWVESRGIVNMRQIYRCGVAFFLTSLFLFSALAVTACSKQTSTAEVQPFSSSNRNLLAVIQTNRSLSASLSAVMTFGNTGTQFSFPSSFGVDLIPISWMDLIFNGKLSEAGPGEDVTYEVHGSVSRDGNWLESAYFSAQIIRVGSKNGNFFRVTLRNAPIVKLAGGIAPEPGKFELTGTEVQKYVAKIEYLDGPLVNGQVSTLTDYISTDWKNNGPGQAPALKVQFRTEVPPPRVPGQPQPGM
jgi:hypothetical protein